MTMATDCTLFPAFDSKRKQSFRRRLLAWFAKHKRDLPWRHSINPYRIWVSEVMLQQTNVKMAKPFFERFLKTFPTVDKLAEADESQVLRLWEGLGYYRRARGMHAAAKQVVADYGGQFPRDVVSLQSLPGIGRYTAGAIASMAYGERAPILETNTVRLFARLLAYPDDPTKSVGQKLLWDMAKQVLPRTNIAHFNQALMELGSLVCTPTSPKCGECPVSPLCGAFQTGLQNEIPKAAAKTKFTAVREAAVIVKKNGHVLIRQCGVNERWAGLWDFPRFEITSEGPLFVREELLNKTHAQTGIAIKPGNLLTTIKHGVTRFRITLDCYGAQYASGRVSADKQIRWIRPVELRELPLSATGRKLANLVKDGREGG
jgi:A/G-specific adenine glycosylase